MHSRYVGVRDRANRGVERLRNEELHDLYSRYFCVREGATREMEKTA